MVFFYKLCYYFYINKACDIMTIEKLLDEIRLYNPDEIENVKKAYELAKEAHKDQKRESGEPYIIHPLNVCMNLTKFSADGASLVAGMLHDVVEDTDYTLEDIEKEFGSDAAHLVDGVTKISNLHFNTKDDATNANIRRLINSLNDDVRIIIIKLCDRLHNMQTLEFKAPEKRIRSAEETLNIFVPIAYFIGAFRLKCELEDICFSYLDKETFDSLSKKTEEVTEDYKDCIKIADKEVHEMLAKNNINFESRCKVLSVYQLFKKLHKGNKINSIHDLVNYKIIVDTEENCYRVLGLIHKLYTPMNDKFKDYIACPKTNMYRSIHTTVFGPANHILQFQIKTKEMDEINTLGLAAYWKQLQGEGKGKMQHELILNYQFFSTLQDLNTVELTDKDYIERVKNEIFTNNIYVYTLSGEIFELPSGSTIIDFAYKLHTDVGNHLYKAFINGKEVKLTQELNNKDRVFLLQKEDAKPNKTWLNHVVTLNAKRKIKDALK